MDREFRRSIAPVRVGDELDVKIEAVGEKGDGVARKDGFVLFVPNTKEGDEVHVRVTKVLRRMGFAEVVGAGSEKKESEEEPEESESEEEEGKEEPESEEDSEEQSEDTENFGEEDS